jgi:ribonuclease D
MLGRTSTGLAALLESELGVRIAKDMQQHDWRQRPLDDRMLGYLTQDVAHLETLDDHIWAQVNSRGIADEVLEETGYRLACAFESVRASEPAPAYVRVKGVEKLRERERAVLRAVAEVREREAARRDVPPHRVASNAALLAIAAARPATVAAYMRIPGVVRAGPDATPFAEQVVRAVASAGDALPAEERARFERPRPAVAEVRARRERESRLLAWRREEARRRGVDEQVVLPGHCAKDAVQDELRSTEELSRIAGIGAFRVVRDGEAILRALRGEGDGEGATA